jgi:tetratricopeptide (TPR) repeat protein
LATILRFSGAAVAEAIEQARQSAEIEESLAVSEPTPAQRARLGRSYSKHGFMLGAAGKTVESLARLRQAIAVLEPLAAAGDSEAKAQLSTAYSDLADILVGGQAVAGVVPDLAAALRAERRALALSEALWSGEPSSPAKRRNVMVDRLKIGERAARAADLATALEQFRGALPLVEAMSREDPANVQAQSDEAFVCQRIGTVMARSGDPLGGAELLRRALAKLADVLRKDPASLMTRARIADSHTGLGYAHAALGAESTLLRAERAEHYRMAMDHFGEGRAFWKEMRDSGRTAGEEAAIPDKLAAQIANCERALGRLAAI